MSWYDVETRHSRDTDSKKANLAEVQVGSIIDDGRMKETDSDHLAMFGHMDMVIQSGVAHCIA